MPNRALKFPNRGDSEFATGRELSPQQRFISEARAIIAEVGGEVPHPGVLGLWKRKLFGNDADATLRALATLAELGAIRSVGYTAVRLRSGVADGLFQTQARHAPLSVGTISANGLFAWNGEDWDPIVGPGGGRA